MYCGQNYKKNVKQQNIFTFLFLYGIYINSHWNLYRFLLESVSFPIRICIVSYWNLYHFPLEGKALSQSIVKKRITRTYE